MTSQTENDLRSWRRLIVGAAATGAVAVGMLIGAPSAVAQPADPTTETETPTPEADESNEPCTGEDCKDDDEAESKMSADRALRIIYSEYAQGEGGGQVSKLIDDAMNLRRQGFRPSNANAAALEDALAHRPHQTPLVEALKETIAYQRKLQARAQMSVDRGGPVPVIPSPHGGVKIPVG